MLLSKCRARLLCTLLLLVLTLTACAPQGVSNPTLTPNGSAGDAAGYQVPLENRKGMWSGLGEKAPSSATDGYYKVAAGHIEFFDAAAKATVVLCAQPGCSHSDETCQAWIGSVASLTEYHGQIYAIRSGIFNSGSVEFIRKDLSDGSITVLAEWKATDIVSYTASLGRIADGMAVVNLKSEISQDDGENFRIDTVSSTWLFNLETGERRELFPGEDGLSILALSKSYVVVQYQPEEQNFLLLEDFYVEYGEDLSYGRYLGRTTNYELRLYDADFNDYTVLTSTSQGFVPYSEYSMTYGKELVYVEGDGVFLVNVDTGESRRLLTMENIINYLLLDHKVFLISTEGNVLDTDSPIAIWCADITDGELIQLKNGGRTDYMVHSISSEGQSFFLDTMSDYIAKADFYAEELP